MPALLEVKKADKLEKLAQYATRVWHITEGTNEEKINQLWETLLKLCRIEGIEPKDTYRHHMAKLRRRCEALNKLDLKSLRYTCETALIFY